MKRALIACAALSLMSGAALADGFKNCTTAAESEWKTMEEIKAMAETAGYEVRKIEKEGSCYEVYGIASDGALMELFFNPTNGEIMKSEKKS
ncbi:MAG: PepSY domain-containing protein [Rhizobiales bacterium]|nr:PepSY domain-containing protein [Hyphomicrobiales bacterium]